MVGCWAEPTVAVRVGLRAARTAVQKTGWMALSLADLMVDLRAS